MLKTAVSVVLAAFLFAGGIVGAAPADAQQESTQQEPSQAVPAPEIYSRVEFAAPTEEVLTFLAESGLIAGVLSEYPVVAELSESELDIVDAAGVEYTVLIADAAAAYAAKARLEVTNALDLEQPTVANPIPVPAHFEVDPPGSMGGFYTYSQVLAELDQMAAFRPDLITTKQSIGDTLEGRPIYMVKISDNPATDEAEPEVLYNSLIHAREPMAMTSNIFFMWHLLEEYDNDPDVKNLVDNTEMYFVPVINVDGYLYNEATNPNGGGMWRKNRRNNGNGTFGVDLNRNWGYEWGYDNVGSSPTTSSTVYRGPSAFSEPETQVLRDYTLSRDFEIALNYHSAAAILIHPWSYDPAGNTADPKYTVLGEVLMRDNDYGASTAANSLGRANGESTDWFYGGAGVFGFVPEVGPASGGFWPATSQIIDLAQDWVETNKMTARVAGVWGEAQDLSASAAIAPGAAGQIDYNLQRLGLQDGPLTVTVTPLTANVSSSCAPAVFNLAFDELAAGSCSFTVDSGATAGEAIQLEVAVNNGDYDITTFVANFSVLDPNAVVLLDGSFDTGTDGFGYSDDTFRSTNQPTYAGGQYVASDGFTGGGVEVTLGGINGNDILGMSGGWTNTFTVPSDSDVVLSLRYDLRQEGTEESDELSQALVAIDGALVGVSPNDYLAQLAGDGNTGPPITTGWQIETLDLGQLTAGSHTITIGGYLSKKTLADETTTVVFDDVSITGTPVAPVNQAPTAVAAAAPVSGITPLAVVFDGSGSSDSDGTIVTYAWDFGDTTSGTGATPSHTYTAAGTYTAVLTVTDDLGATATDTIEITVTNQGPTAVALATPPTGDAPLVVGFDGTDSTDPDGTIVTYAWDFGDTTSGTGATPSHTYTAAGTYSAVLTVTDNLDATDTDTVVITVTTPPNQNPIADVVATPTTGDAPLAVSFDGSGSSDSDGTIATYSWVFGDGTTGTGATTSHTYVAAGEYTAELTVTDNDGGTDTDTVAITATPPNQEPTADVVATPTTGDVPLLVSFNGSSSTDPDGTIDTYAWDFGDGTTGTGATTSHTYVAAGEYTAELTVTDNLGATGTDTVAITVTTPPNQDPTAVAIATSATSGDAPLTVGFDGSGSSDPDGTIASYDWDFGDGSPTGAGVTPSHEYSAPGTYNVSLTVTDDDGASDTANDAITVTVAEPPVAGLQAETGVVGGVGDTWQTVSLTNTYTSPVVVATVRVPDSAATPVVARVRSAGTTSFELRVQNPSGTAASGYDVQYVVVEEGVYTAGADGVTMEALRAASSITAENGNWALEGRTYQNSYTNPVVVGQVMTANDADYSVFWASSATSRSNPPNAAGFAAGKHVAEDPDATRADETIGYIVIEAGSGTIDGLSYETGIGSDTVQGTGNTSSGYTYSLSATPGPIAGVASSAAMDGTDGGWPVLYGAAPLTSAELTLAIDEDQTNDTERSHTTEQVAYLVFGGDPPPNQDPIAVVSATPATGNAPLTVAFDGTSSSDPDGTIVSYDWDFGDGGADTGATASYTYTTAGPYTATLTVTDNQGGSAADTVTITVDDPPPSSLQVERGVVTGVGDTWQTIALSQTYVAPVIVATVRMPDSAATPVVTRVRNAAPSSFELQVQSTDGSAVSGYDVHYLVVEEGTYTAAADGVTMEAVRANSSITAENNNWAREGRAYLNIYTNPVVIGQVMTDNDPDWSVFWASSATSRTSPPNASGFAAGKHVGEDPDATRADETIGYLVIEAGSGTIDGLAFEAALGSDIVRGTGNTNSGYVYGLSASPAPVVAVLSSAAMDGGHGAWPALYGATPLAANQLTLVVDEDQAGDSERSHTTEQIAYIVFG